VRRLLLLGATLGMMTLGCSGTTTEKHVISDTPANPDSGSPDAGPIDPDGSVGEDSGTPTGNDPNNCVFSESIQNPGGKLHSEPCESDDECLYGLCHLSPAVATFKFCTKNPYCGPGTECGSDDVEGLTYKAQLFNKNSYPNETAMEICTQTCSSVEDCPAGFTGCATVTGVVKTCVAE